MPQPNTTQIFAPIDTTNETDPYATHKSWRGQGGWSEVADLTERNNITTERRHQGMGVWVVSENKLYVLKTGITNTDWVEFSGGGGGGSFLESNTALVDQNLGNDLTGEIGNLSKPFKTYSAASLSITDESPTNPYVIEFSPGTHGASGTEFYPNINIVGYDKNSSIINFALTPNSSFLDADSTFSCSNVSISSTYSIICNFKAIPSPVYSSNYYYNNCILNKCELFGRKSSTFSANDTFHFDSCTVNDTVSLSSVRAIFKNGELKGNLIIDNAIDEETLAFFINNDLKGITIKTYPGAAKETVVLIRNSVVNGDITLDGTSGILVVDSMTLSATSITLLNGATLDQVRPDSDSRIIIGCPLQAADLSGLQNWGLIHQMREGQLGTAIDTGIVYRLDGIRTPPSIPHIWNPIITSNESIFNLDPSLTSPDDPYILGTNAEDVLSINWNNFDNESGNDPLSAGVITAFIYLPNTDSPALTTSTSNGKTAKEIAESIAPTKQIKITGNRNSILLDTSTQQSKLVVTFSNTGGLFNGRQLSDLYTIVNFDGQCLIQTPIRFSYDMQYGGSLGGSTSQWQYNAPNIFFGTSSSMYDGWLNEPEQNTDGQLGRYSVNQSQNEALTAANAPSLSNPFATIDDLSSFSGAGIKESGYMGASNYYAGLNVAAPGQTLFTVSQNPVSENSFSLYLNGKLLSVGIDYTRTGQNITFIDTSITLTEDDDLTAWYNISLSGISYDFTTITVTSSDWSAPTASSPTINLRLVKIGKFVSMNIDDWLAVGDGNEGVISTTGGVIPVEYRPSTGKAAHKGIKCIRVGASPTVSNGFINITDDGIVTIEPLISEFSGVVEAPGGTGSAVTISYSGEIDVFQTVNGQQFGFSSTTVDWIQE